MRRAFCLLHDLQRVSSGPPAQPSLASASRPDQGASFDTNVRATAAARDLATRLIFSGSRCTTRAN
jgi:hypothetical protein